MEGGGAHGVQEQYEPAASGGIRCISLWRWSRSVWDPAVLALHHEEAYKVAVMRYILLSSSCS